MHRFVVLICISVLLSAFSSCRNMPVAGKHSTEEQGEKVIPTICVYTLGDVQENLLDAMLDSLQTHYPKCRIAGGIDLPDAAKTTKRHDHIRYRADLLNKILGQHKSDSTIVIGLTQVDIGLDNFRDREHSGIMGLASGIGTGVAVFSSYRPHGYGQLFSVMLHEIGHAQGLRHCPDKHCIMQNANGGNPFNKTDKFCVKCRDYMLRRNWNL